MSGAVWRCAVCEGVNHGGRTCATCGAALTRRSALATAARGRFESPLAPPPTESLPDPLRRAINREPIGEHELVHFETEPRFDVVPLPGGCLVSVGPGGRRRRRRGRGPYGAWR